MSAYQLRELNLKPGEMIYIVNEKGEGISGVYENNYCSSNETFKFSNHSNGKTEIINANNLQFIKRY